MSEDRLAGRSLQRDPGPCGWGGFQCNNDSCIDIDLVNNGYPDCVDNSDEGVLVV